MPMHTILPLRCVIVYFNRSLCCSTPNVQSCCSRRLSIAQPGFHPCVYARALTRLCVCVCNVRSLRMDWRWWRWWGHVDTYRTTVHRTTLATLVCICTDVSRLHDALFQARKASRSTSQRHSGVRFGSVYFCFSSVCGPRGGCWLHLPPVSIVRI